jgi:hypothetical protein
MEYFVTDKPFPRGELVVKTKAMAMGYFKNDKETDQAFRDGEGREEGRGGERRGGERRGKERGGEEGR